MATATWNGAVLAASDDTIVVEGNYYFPPDALDQQYFEASETTSVCPWKGTANYYDLVVDRRRNSAAAWYYPQPKAAAASIQSRVAFWKGVRVDP